MNTRLYYDLEKGVRPPRAGEYIGTIGKDGESVNSLYLILSVTAVKHRLPTEIQRYNLSVQRVPDEKPFAVYDKQKERLYVRGEIGWALFWYSRNG